MEPITREEYYLAKIAGTYKGKTPEPVTIDEYYLATMAGDYSGNTPQPVTRLQYYMAKVAGVWGGSIPAPVTRLEYYWAAIASGEGKVFPPVTREEHFLVLVADAYSVVLTVVTGNPALLENSKGNRGLESLTLYGKSTQGSAPSPSNPQEIENAGQSGEIGVDVLGKNLIPFPYPILGGAGVQTEKEGVKYTVQGDGGIRCTGTPSSQFGVTITRIAYSATALSISNPSNGKIVLSGGELYFDPKNNALFIYYNPSQVGQPLNTVFYPQIELGTVATSYEKYKPAQKLIIPASGGLPGIPVSSGGNYTDEKGQQWVCDEVDFKKGVYVQRVAKEIPNTSLRVVETPDVKGRYSFTKAFKNIYKNGEYKCLISHGIYGRWGTTKDTWAMIGAAFVYSPEERTTEDKLKEKILSLINSDNPLTFLGQLETPIEIPLTTEQFAKYKALRTYSPTTTVINDAGAGMSVGYAKMK